MTITADFRQAVYGQESGDVVVVLLTITHPDLDVPLRVSSHATERVSDDPVSYVTRSQGHEYLYLPFRLEYPESAAGKPPAATLTLSNINRDMVEMLRGSRTAARVKMDLIRLAAPDVIEQTWPEFDATSATWGVSELALQLTAENHIAEPAVALTFNPRTAPALFLS